jgi:hypothetical protein
MAKGGEALGGVGKNEAKEQRMADGNVETWILSECRRDDEEGKGWLERAKEIPGGGRSRRKLGDGTERRERRGVDEEFSLPRERRKS